MANLHQSNGGAQIDTSRLHRQFVPTYDLDGPHRLKTPVPSVGSIILAVIVMAVTIAVAWLRIYP